MLLDLLLVLLTFPLIRSNEIEIIRSGQHKFPSKSKSIGTVLYVDLFNPFNRTIYLSAVVERCCRTIEQCLFVRLLGGDFGHISSKMNRSIHFLWPSIYWSDVHESIFCEVSIFFGTQLFFTHHQTVDIRLRSIPFGMDFSQTTRLISSPFQLPNSPLVTYPKCNQYLNLVKNQCETLEHLRQRLPRPTLISRLIPSHPQSSSQHTSRSRYFSNKSYFHQLIIITILLVAFYAVLLFISCLFICSADRQHQQEEESVRSSETKFWSDEHFSLIETSIDDDLPE